jgi:N-methylhydantoinase A
MESEARGLLVEAGAQRERIELHRTADLRYVGQGFEVTVPIPDGVLSLERLPDIKEYFYKAYQQLFERHITDVPIESMSWRLAASGPVPNIELNFGGQPTAQLDPRKGERQVYFPETGFARCTVYSRYSLTPGLELIGPLVIEERESTTVVGPGARASVDRYLNLLIDID